MVKKAVDPRINTLIRNGVQKNHRSFFILIGDKGKEQIVNLHWMLTQAKTTGRPSVLWCYKKELGFTSHRRKREAKIKKDIKRGIREPNKEDPFEMFITLTDIRYTYYKESENVLGNTFGMCVLQDFEALTPNLLARTVETVEGGGIIVLLLKSMKSLKQLYTLTMDAHTRYRTESHNDVVGRFNERFILSLIDCKDCLFIDDELNVLSISHGKSVKPLTDAEKNQQNNRNEKLSDLKVSLEDSEPIGSLIKLAKTYDQAKTIMQFADIISSKTLRSTVALTAGRGRGKSAALGISLACAVANGYSNIFVTSPSPSNLKTLFEFLFKGFDALGYEEHMDYDIIMSTSEILGVNCVVRVNIFKQHRQTIQYIVPQDAHTLSQAELLVIDEAAAIPLPLVSKLLGPYLVFMSSTINGYEGTGRSLSLKLIKQLRSQSVSSSKSNSETENTNKLSGSGRQLHEISLTEPIRYSINDRVELWLNSLLCLDASVVTKSITGCPHPDKCELFWVNRDTLFSYHPVSEAFLQKMIALYVASHYKNSPNDLQLMSDAPAHELFVLLSPVDTTSNKATLPEPLCVIQVCLEGQISKETLMRSLNRGMRSGGDLIPWLISQQYQDENFSSLSGARVVRIATHPDYTSMGYGTKALQLLEDYYSGKIISVNESISQNGLDDKSHAMKRVTDKDLENVDQIDTDIKVRDLSSLPPLFLRLSEKGLPNLHWLGVSYGLTINLFKFWKRSGYSPVYLRQTTSELTGEHTVVMLKDLPINKPSFTSASNESALTSTNISNKDWLKMFTVDFTRRIINLFGYEFSKFPSVLGISILEAAKKSFTSENDQKKYTIDFLNRDFLPWDLKRLQSYSNNILDYHVIMDLFPKIAQLYFTFLDFNENVSLSGVQQCILLAMGLQHKSIDDLVLELGLTSSVLLAMLVKIIKKVITFLNIVQSEALENTLPKTTEEPSISLVSSSKTLAQSLVEELENNSSEEESVEKKSNQEEIDEIVKDITNDRSFAKYQIIANDTDIDKESIKLGNVNPNTNTVISIKTQEGNIKGSGQQPSNKANGKGRNTPKSKNKRKSGTSDSLNLVKNTEAENQGKNTLDSSESTKTSVVAQLVQHEETRKTNISKKAKMSKKTRKF
ncbi:hypothetical protein BB561_003849 [Smittium simulii]|uniref:RNA cytidine acetyltransferase n=1 Tax=Smittium simulii TaxID=133385 RepID=A0A2T9YJB2_9FUNG|nr:hypothetical protein BB561_003849 [Smittium simulii]